MAAVDLKQIINNLSSINSYGFSGIQRTGLSQQSNRQIQDRLATTNRAQDMAGSSSASGSENVRTRIYEDMKATSQVMVAAGSLQQIENRLMKMKQMTEAAAKSNLSPEASESMKKELTVLRNEIDEIVKNSNMEGKNLIAGPGTGTEKTNQVVLSNGQTISVGYGQNFKASSGTNDGRIMGKDGLGLTDDALQVDTAANAKQTTDRIDLALATVRGSKEQAFGIGNTLSLATGMSSPTRDTAMMDAAAAEETLGKTRSLILQETGKAMLAQANMVPQRMAGLLR